MSVDVEELLVTAINAGVTAGELPALVGFQVEPLANQINPDTDALNVAGPSALVAQSTQDCTEGLSQGDPMTIVVLLIVPGADQLGRRRQAWGAARQLRDWLTTPSSTHNFEPAPGSGWEPQRIDTIRLHPYAAVALNVTYLGGLP